MSTATKTLTPAQWQEVYSLPPDGKSYNIPGVAFRASHHPQTKMHCEQVIAETQFGKLRRRLVSGRWQATEYI